MDCFDGTWNIEVDSKHSPRTLHGFFICDVVVRDRHSELKHSQLDVTSSTDVPVHVYFVVESLLMLYHETLVRRVFIAF